MAANDLKLTQFKYGLWIWNEVDHILQFISRDMKEQVVRLLQHTGSGITSFISVKPILNEVKFKGTIDNLELAKFRIHCQRRVLPNEPNIITLQDIKDIALFSAHAKDLSYEFINFFHTERIDGFLRSLIIYFQYYFQIWDTICQRREEAKRKLRQPIVYDLENLVRDNLADLRSIVARNYSYIILGLIDVNKFYHMKGKNSLSDRDRRLFETFFPLAAHTVWIALKRKNLTLIETEINRMFRTQIFNPIERDARNLIFHTFPHEDRVLLGQAYAVEKKLKHRSPAIQELIFGVHDFRLLTSGILKFDLQNDRLKYFEMAFTAPEEKLSEMKMKLGILGLPRDNFDVMFVERKKRKMENMRDEIPEFRIPPKLTDIGLIDKSLFEKAVQYIETKQMKRVRKTQRKIWQKYVMGQGALHDGTHFGEFSSV